MLTLRPVVPALLCALAAVAILPSTAAAEGWLAPEPALTDAGVGTQVGVGPSGAPVLAYVTGDATPKIAVFVRKPGESYERTDLTPEPDGGSIDLLGVGVDAAGDVAIAYRRGFFAIYVASRAAGATGFTNRTLAGGTAISTTNTAYPRFAVTPAGTILLSLPEFTSAGVVLGSFDGALTRQTLSYPAQPLNATNAVLGVGRGSDVVLAITDTRQGASASTAAPSLLVSRRGADGTFAPLSVLDEPGESANTGGSSVGARFPTVAVGADGAADVAWSLARSTMVGSTVDVRALRLPAGSAATDTPDGARTVASLSGAAGTHSVSTPALARARDGSATAVFTDNGTSGTGVSTSTRPAGSATFPAPTNPPYTSASRSLLGAFSSDDGVEAVFQPGSTRVESAPPAPGGGLGPLVARYEPGAGTTLGSSFVGSSGANAAVVSTVTQGSATNVVLTLRDATPPTLGLAGVPAAATAGTAAALSAVAADAIDAAPAVTWDFGDGTTGAGASTSHAWATPGSYTVKASASDASANATTAVKTVVVSAPPSGATGSPGPGPGPGPGPFPPPTDKTAPSLSGVKLAPSRVTRKKPTTALSLTLSEPARLAVTVTTTKPGVKQGKTCKAARRVKRGQRRCTAKVTVLSRTATAAAGATKLTLTLKAPAKGSYAIAVVATDAAGNASVPVTAKLNVT